MRIIIDAMGGDNAPSEIIKGVALAAKECISAFTLVGDSEEIARAANAYGLAEDRFSVIHTSSVITMEDDPLAAIQKKRDSSLMTGLSLLAKGEGNAFVSAGNTGALFAGATLTVKRLDGFLRAAIGTVLPGVKPCLLLDSGANVTVSAEQLEQFAVMGTSYMQKIKGVAEPAVGLLNIGTEDCKGTPVHVEANRRLAACESVRYIGNIEANSVLFGACDVLLTDGFTGNVLLKTVEGMGRFLLKTVGTAVSQSSDTELQRDFSHLAHRFDPAEQGGAPILGLSKPVIKAHGSSDARAFKNAVLEAIRYAESGAVEELQKTAANYHTLQKLQKQSN